MIVSHALDPTSDMNSLPVLIQLANLFSVELVILSGDSFFKSGSLFLETDLFPSKLPRIAYVKLVNCILSILRNISSDGILSTCNLLANSCTAPLGFLKNLAISVLNFLKLKALPPNPSPAFTNPAPGLLAIPSKSFAAPGKPVISLPAPLNTGQGSFINPFILDAAWPPMLARAPAGPPRKGMLLNKPPKSQGFFVGTRLRALPPNLSPLSANQLLGLAARLSNSAAPSGIPDRNFPIPLNIGQGSFINLLDATRSPVPIRPPSSPPMTGTLFNNLPDPSAASNS